MLTVVYTPNGRLCVWKLVVVKNTIFQEPGMSCAVHIMVLSCSLAEKIKDILPEADAQKGGRVLVPLQNLASASIFEAAVFKNLFPFVKCLHCL